MKKLTFILTVFITFGLVMPVFAANTGSGTQNTNTGQQVNASSSPLGTGNQIKNQNQVNTQNQGQDSQLQVNTQEEESTGEGQGESLETRNQKAIENMSEVAKQVQLLLQTRTTGGIGEQVRLIAQEQDQAQTQIQEQLNKLDSKSKLARFISGTNYSVVKNLKAQMEQNVARIKQLEQLQNKLYYQSDIIMFQEAIQALIQENISLQERITAEEQTKSLLGWLFRLFAK